MKGSLVLLLSTCLSFYIREGQTYCVSGFVSRERLLGQRFGMELPGGQQRVIPNINFTCDGNITKWTIAGTTTSMGGIVPELQIWRNSNFSRTEYIKVGAFPISDPASHVLQEYKNIYEYIQDPQLAVKSGDCLGIFQPQMAQITLLHIGRSGPTNHVIAADDPRMMFNIQNSMRVQNAWPLVAVEFTAASVVDSTVISPTPVSQPASITTEGSEHTTTRTSSGNEASSTLVHFPPRVTSGSGVSSTLVHFPGNNNPSSSTSEDLIPWVISLAALVLILIVVVIVTVLVLVIYSRNRKYILQTAQMSNGLPSNHHGEDLCDNMEMIISPEGVYEQPREATTPYEAPQLPSITSSQHIYSELNPPAMPFYEFGSGGLEYEIYVPTVGQRLTYSYAAPRPDNNQGYFQESETYWNPASNEADLYEQLSQCKFREIPRHHIKIVEHLGSGNYGVVNKGTWQSLSVGSVDVAVKTLQSRPNCATDRVKFLQEAAIMGQFHHLNVVRLYGVVTVQNPEMIVLEFMSNGDLRHYLIKMRPTSDMMVPSNMPQLCLDFCHQIASGMEYLSSKAFVHRDLAARNILVSGEGICKIADFGMARDLQEEDYYVSRGGQVPVKWTAIEALTFKKYSTNSDVWSYGVVMYEIWSLGHKPFEGYTNMEVIPLLNHGYRLPPPPGCPKTIYEVMIQCWHPGTSSRLTFSQLVQSLSQSEAHLEWSESDLAVHPQAAVLGASLDVGKDLFPQLQQTYMM